MSNDWLSLSARRQGRGPIEKWVLLCSLLFVSCGVFGEPIYKSIDRHGNISYAAEPASNAVTVERIVPLPPPSEEEVRRAEEALEEYRTQTEKERQAYLEWEKEQLRLYQTLLANQALFEASRPPPPPPRQIVYPYGYPTNILYCPYCPKRHHRHLKHPHHGHKTPRPHHRGLQPDGGHSLLPPQRKARSVHRGMKRSSIPQGFSPGHNSFSSDSIFLPANGPTH